MGHLDKSDCCCLSFVHYIRYKTKRISGSLTVCELRQAEVILIRCNQQRSLVEEREYLKNKKGTRPSLVSQLDLFLDEHDVIRCKGRIQHTHLPYDTVNPILLS